MHSVFLGQLPLPSSLSLSISLYRSLSLSLSPPHPEKKTEKKGEKNDHNNTEKRWDTKNTNKNARTHLKSAFMNIPLVSDKCDKSSPEKSVFGSISSELPRVLIIVSKPSRVMRARLRRCFCTEVYRPLIL